MGRKACLQRADSVSPESRARHATGAPQEVGRTLHPPRNGAPVVLRCARENTQKWQLGLRPSWPATWPIPSACGATASPTSLFQTPRASSKRWVAPGPGSTRACRWSGTPQGLPEVPTPGRSLQLGLSIERLVQALKFAKCMRAHGLPNFPDPDVGPSPSGIGIAIRLGGPGSGVNPQSPTFCAAAKDIAR